MKCPHDQGNMKVSLKFGAHSSRGWVYSHHGRSMAGGRQACCGREQWLRAYMWKHWDRVRANWEWVELFKTKAHPSPTRPQLILPKCPPTVGQTFKHTSLWRPLFLTAPHTFRHTSLGGRSSSHHHAGPLTWLRFCWGQTPTMSGPSYVALGLLHVPSACLFSIWQWQFFLKDFRIVSGMGLGGCWP